MEPFIVHLDGSTHQFHPGATVRDLLGRLAPEARALIRTGHAYLGDAQGHELGETGALEPGGSYRVVERAVGG